MRPIATVAFVVGAVVGEVAWITGLVLLALSIF